MSSTILREFKRSNLKGRALLIRYSSDNRLGIKVETANGVADYPLAVECEESALRMPMRKAFLFIDQGRLYKFTWDRPEAIPHYLKRLAYKAWRVMKQMQLDELPREVE